jgi:hypothetical protein
MVKCGVLFEVRTEALQYHSDRLYALKGYATDSYFETLITAEYFRIFHRMTQLSTLTYTAMFDFLVVETTRI